MAYSRRTFLETAGLIGTALAASDLGSSGFALDQSAATPAARLAQTPVLRDRLRGERRPARVSDHPAAWISRTMCARGMASCRRWCGPVTGCSCRICAATGRPAFRDAGGAAYGGASRDRPGRDRLRRRAAAAAVRLAGYDWGGRAAAIAAALHPDRVRATVLIGGYTIQNTLAAPPPASPAAEQRAWYQWYFNTERGRAGLQANRRALCRFLWQTVVAELALHRRDLQPHGGVVRQS